MNLVLIGMVRLYQLGVSPFLGKRCRFYPSCSHYAVESLTVHGAFKGSWLTFLRLIKCHPFHPGGVDLVSHQRIKE
ncbi:MAG: membrane protein insertion efficiency factor YidD [Alphaproteobacteria bacterium]|nr:membrane protein insertion efficiency factor YidD [Alphaproteobacteria bacterium]